MENASKTYGIRESTSSETSRRLIAALACD
jgi:hypothetical protein